MKMKATDRKGVVPNNQYHIETFVLFDVLLSFHACCTKFMILFPFPNDSRFINDGLDGDIVVSWLGRNGGTHCCGLVMMMRMTTRFWKRIL